MTRYFGYTDTSEASADLETRFTGKQDALGLLVTTANSSGLVDARAQLATDGTVAAAQGVALYLKPGTYRVASNLTLGCGIRFAQGAVLKPDAGVTITLSGALDTGLLYHIFDISAGGSVVFAAGSTVAATFEWFGAVGDNTANDLASVQAALSSGAERIDARYRTYKIPGSLTIPSTIRDFVGTGGFRKSTAFNFTGTATSALTIDTDSPNISGLYVMDGGNYTNGIVLAAGRHFGSLRNVATNGAFSKHWALGDNVFDEVPFQIGAWGTSAAGQVGLDIAGLAGNALDFFGCHWVSCETGVWLRGQDCESVNFFGGEIASNTLYGIRIGDGSAWNGKENVSCYGVYFENNRYNIYNDQPTTGGINSIFCRNSATATRAHIFLNQSAESVNVIGGVLRSTYAGAAIVDINNTDSRNITIQTPAGPGYGMVTHVNGGDKWVNATTYPDGFGQQSYEHRGQLQVVDFAQNSFANKCLTEYRRLNTRVSVHDHAGSIVYDNVKPGDPGSTWATTVFTAGSICWNVGVASGQPEGWRCTVAGTPGTWSPMPNHP